jgi:hypothetical protein
VEGGLGDRERSRAGRPGRSGEESSWAAWAIGRGGELSDRLLFLNFKFRSGEEASRAIACWRCVSF